MKTWISEDLIKENGVFLVYRDSDCYSILNHSNEVYENSVYIPKCFFENNIKTFVPFDRDLYFWLNVPLLEKTGCTIRVSCSGGRSLREEYFCEEVSASNILMNAEPRRAFTPCIRFYPYEDNQSFLSDKIKIFKYTNPINIREDFFIRSKRIDPSKTTDEILKPVIDTLFNILKNDSKTTLFFEQKNINTLDERGNVDVFNYSFDFYRAFDFIKCSEEIKKDILNQIYKKAEAEGLVDACFRIKVLDMEKENVIKL